MNRRPKTPSALLFSAAIALLLALAACGSSDGSSDGNGAGEKTGVFDIKVGDCLADFSATDGPIETVPSVPCSEPHEVEAFLQHKMTQEDFPGDDEVELYAEDVCVNGFEDFVGVAYDESELDTAFLHPTEDSWKIGDREVLCLVGDPNDSAITGTLESAGR